LNQSKTSLACRICGGSAKYTFAVRDEKIVRCASCGLIQLGRRLELAEVEEVYGQGYFKKIKYSLDRAARLEQERRLRVVQRAGVNAGSKMLDMGCATGDFLVAARGLCEVWGRDVSQHAIAIARQRLPELSDRLHAGPATIGVFPDGFFDAITMWDVIEHLDSPLEAVKGLSRFIKPAGALIISTPNSGAAIARVMGKRWAFMTPPEHVCLFSRRTLARMMSECGFRERWWITRGKWINVAFLVYKAGRVFPELVPSGIREWMAGSALGRACVYIPTGDIQYGVYERGRA
jgi:2-polyprenyl-3-methyl-5-hydroxy-6-metoxy-1,4-benzoquinol methylase